MKRIFIYCTVFFGVTGWNANCQETLTLDEAHEKLEMNYPLAKEYDLHRKISELKIKNVHTTWYPQLKFNAQATYQSDVIELGGNISIPNFNLLDPPKDQYKVSVDINQVIYDGGQAKAMSSLETKTTEASLQEVKISMYKLKERLNNLYFNVLLMEKYRVILDSIINNLDRTEKTVEAALEYGVVLPSDLYALQAEIIKMEKQYQDVGENKKSSMKMLQQLTGSDQEYTLVDPACNEELMDSIIRPEEKLFTLQKEKLDYSRDLLSARRLPKIYAFSQFGYGNPGLNMLNDEFDSFYIIGARLQWNIWDWNQTNRKKQITEVQKSIIDAQKDAFLENVDLSLEKKKAEIKKYKNAILKDSELLELRKKISSISQSRFENGTIPASEYLDELNKELQAELSLEAARIQLTSVIIDYNTLVGK